MVIVNYITIFFCKRPALTSNSILKAEVRKAKTWLEALLLEGLDAVNAAPMTDTDWEEVRRDIRERVPRRKLEELRRDMRQGFEQIARGE